MYIYICQEKKEILIKNEKGKKSHLLSMSIYFVYDILTTYSGSVNKYYS